MTILTIKNKKIQRLNNTELVLALKKLKREPNDANYDKVIDIIDSIASDYETMYDQLVVITRSITDITIQVD